MTRRSAKAADGSGVLARAEFTIDMLRNLLVVFEAASGDKPVLVELCDRAVWAVTADGHRLLIGHKTVEHKAIGSKAGPQPYDA